MSDDLTEKQREILEVIRENPEMTKDEIAEAADTSKSYVTRVRNNYDVSVLEGTEEESESTGEEERKEDSEEDEATEAAERESTEESEEDEATDSVERESTEERKETVSEYESDPSEITAKGGIGGIVMALLLFGGVWFYYQTQILGTEIPFLFLV